MICKKCGKEIPDESVYCAHCGYDLRGKDPSNHNTLSEEQIPLILLVKQIVKHKVAVIVSIIAIIICVCGYYAYKKHQEKVAAEAILKGMIEHYVKILGTYENTSCQDPIQLTLHSDNTALFIINYDEYNERRYKGYWKEKGDNYPIEINLSRSFEGYIGNKKRYSCSTLYLYDDRLWESMDAIRSSDYGASVYLEKK